MKNTLKPNRLIVLKVWLPDHENPNQPGPKYRPVLLLDVNPLTNEILVIYGTSQNTSIIRRGEFTVHLDCLAKPTKFCCSYQRWIPATDLYLCRNGEKHVLGFLTKNYYSPLLDALKEIQI